MRVPLPDTDPVSSSSPPSSFCLIPPCSVPARSQAFHTSAHSPLSDGCTLVCVRVWCARVPDGEALVSSTVASSPSLDQADWATPSCFRSQSVYCTALLAVLFTSTCYTHLANVPSVYPAASSSASTSPSTANASVPTSSGTVVSSLLLPNVTLLGSRVDPANLTLTTPDPVRCFCDANGFHLTDPVLVGYRRRDAIFAAEDQRDKIGHQTEEASPTSSQTSDDEAAAAARQEDRSWARRASDLVVPQSVKTAYAWLNSFVAPNSERLEDVVPPPPPPPVPRWNSGTSRLDVRPRAGFAKDVGFVLDFGWGRSEQVVADDLERARVARRGAIEEEKANVGGKKG